MMSLPPRLSVTALLALVLATSACASHARRDPSGAAPAQLLGTFADDYGGSYVITSNEWRHGPIARYHIVKWDTASGYLIARNGAGNPTGAGLWTRIDWIPLTGMAPYEWAFCMSAYEPPSAAEAERTETTKPAEPRTGCNGYPYSRMKRVSPPARAAGRRDRPGDRVAE